MDLKTLVGYQLATTTALESNARVRWKISPTYLLAGPILNLSE